MPFFFGPHGGGGVKRKWEGLIWSFFKKGLGGTFQGIESILKYLGGGGWIGDGLGAREEYNILLDITLFVFVLTKLHKKILAKIITQKSLELFFSLKFLYRYKHKSEFSLSKSNHVLLYVVI